TRRRKGGLGRGRNVGALHSVCRPVLSSRRFRMCSPRQSRALARLCVAAVAALTVCLATSEPVSAQYIIAPDQSFVVVGQQQPFPVGGSFVVGPAGATQGNTWVRIGGTFSMTSFRMDNSSIIGFIKPFNSTDRALASTLYGGKNPPRTIVVGPFQKWW